MVFFWFFLLCRLCFPFSSYLIPVFLFGDVIWYGLLLLPPFMYSEIEVSVSPSCEYLETSWIHQVHSTGNSFTVWVVGRDARTREAMRVFGASVHSEPIVPNLGLPQGTEIPTDERASRRESGFGGSFQRSKSVFLGAVDAIRWAAERSQRNLESLKHWWPQWTEQFGMQ